MSFGGYSTLTEWKLAQKFHNLGYNAVITRSFVASMIQLSGGRTRGWHNRRGINPENINLQAELAENGYAGQSVALTRVLAASLPLVSVVARQSQIDLTNGTTNLDSESKGGIRSAVNFLSNSYTAITQRINVRKAIRSLKEKIKAIDWITIASIAASPVSLLIGLFASMFGVKDPDTIMLGPLPLGRLKMPDLFPAGGPCAVEEIEIAMSNKTVKFRATGSVFLAHQEGGKNSVTITGKLFGKNRHIYFWALWLMTMIGQGRTRNISATKFIELGNEITSLQALNTTSNLFQGSTPVTGEIEGIQAFNGNALEKPKEIVHIAFPLISKHAMILNCYIETFSFEETTQDGKDIINFTLLLRTYVPQRKYYKKNNYYATTNKLAGLTDKIIGLVPNMAYQMVNWLNEKYLLDKKDWKTENYYDVDPVDVAAAAVISGLGVSAAISGV